MKKIITNFLLFIFCSIPRLIKAQMGIDNIHITNEETSSAPKFIESISFIPSVSMLSTAFAKIGSSSKKGINVPGISRIEEIEKLSRWQVKYAMMLDVAVETIKNITLYQFIENWYGTRYRMGGNTKKGIDCSAFTDNLLSAVYNLLLPRTAREQYRHCEHISKDDLLEGDLVFFNTKGGVSHVGVYLANGRFVHSSVSRGVMISSLSDNYFSRRYIGGGRVQND
ncbi:MAG: NlpC/P60 family protein [Ginsengibacter sp.]